MLIVTIDRTRFATTLVATEQATGGAGSIFEYAKNELSAQDFSSLSAAVPGIGDLIGAAPDTETQGGSSMLSGIANQLGGSALLADKFSALGLSPTDVQKFVPVVVNYVETTGGPAASKLLAGLF
jgi:hypothetical protein